MPLIVALEGKDGLLVAADSRGTIGDPRALTAISDAHTSRNREAESLWEKPLEKEQ